MPVPQPPSKIWLPTGTTGFAPDQPVIQDATYAFTNVDRNYLDSQALGGQTHLVQSLIGGTVCTWAFLDGGSGAGTTGQVVCLAGTAASTVTLALASPMALAGSAFGVLMTSANPGSWVRVARIGLLPPSITGIPTSGASLYAKVNTSTATITTVSSLLSTDFPLGSVDGAGNLNLLPQFTPLGASAAAPWLTVNANTTLTTAQSGSKLRTDTTGGTLNTITLPAAPTDGCTYLFLDATAQWAAHNLTINGNGHNIVSPATVGSTGATAATFVASQIRANFPLTWDNTNTLWQVA